MSTATVQPKGTEVRQMFGRIAAPYDFLNRAFSGGIDLWWRKVLACRVKRHIKSTSLPVLDLACGSGDVLIALKKAGLTSLVGADFCLPMLLLAEQKIHPPSRKATADKSTSSSSHTGNGWQADLSAVALAQADALNLPFSDNSFAAVTIAFGYRNFEKRDLALAEIRRVLQPGGHLHILEFSQPWCWVCPFYYFYLRNIMPLAARIFCRDADAYKYLATTINHFPPVEAIGGELTTAGFTGVAWTRHTFGTVAIHTGRRD